MRKFATKLFSKPFRFLNLTVIEAYPIHNARSEVELELIGDRFRDAAVKKIIYVSFGWKKCDLVFLNRIRKNSVRVVPTNRCRAERNYFVFTERGKRTTGRWILSFGTYGNENAQPEYA